jgi:endoglucanase
MLTLTAARVLNDTHDPFYTSLQEGAYDKVKPKGRPCDAAISDGCKGGHLGRNATIALAVSISVVGAIVLGLSAWYLIRVIRSRRGKY